MQENLALHGSVSEGFEAAKQEFARVAADEDADLSAQFVVYHQGKRVVDLWTGPDLTGDSLLGVYSASKGAAHLVVALLVQDGILDLDERVSHYWPEFSANGKHDIILRDLMAHRAGLVGPDMGLSLKELSDDRAVAQRIGQQRPYWRPGTAFGYHALVIAALTGERECPEVCVSGLAHGFSDTQAAKRSPNIMANWLRAANHSRTFRPSFSKLRIAR
ncbi:serine hydrolase domain-containing protein [Komagataeibacter europaeus]|uniref:serine hydrolase domain-containing protein n=1 Tax=Komagataeibacter europaeus TaxID=33995 RepID=UPI0012DEC374